jgi:hypothetical protein
MFQYPKDPDEFRYYIAATMSAYILMMQVFIDPISKYTKGFDVSAWSESTKQLLASTEEVRSALAAAGKRK